MVEALALKIANNLKKIEPERTHSVEVMKFALEALLNSLITIVLISIIGLVTKSIGDTFIGLGAFAILRFLSGGLHLRNSIHCSLVSTIFIAVSPHIPLNNTLIISSTIISLIIILIFAPANIAGHARIPIKYFPLLKLLSAIIICMNLFFLSSTISIAFMIQAITAISFKKGVIS